MPEAITWCFTPPGAKELGIHHQYASYNWTKPVQYGEEVGEIITDPRPWSNGYTRPGLVGTNYCGSPWTGRLTRLSSPMPVNDYGLCATCNVPNLCQAYLGRTPTLNQNDGAGFLPMTVSIAGNRWWRPNSRDGGATRWTAVRGGTSSCRGSSPLLLRLTTPTFGLLNAVDLYAVDTTTNAGSWFQPLSSPHNPGLILFLDS